MRTPKKKTSTKESSQQNKENSRSYGTEFKTICATEFQFVAQLMALNSKTSSNLWLVILQHLVQSYGLDYGPYF